MTPDPFAEVRAEYRASLPARLERLERLRAALAAGAGGAGRPELEREIHSLAGSGRTFGLAALSAAAQQAEALLERPGAPDWARLGELLGAMRASLVEAPVSHRLADGRRVVIRPIRPDDEPREGDFLAHLSEPTRRRRFMKYADVAGEALVHFFTHIDYDRHMAFVCEAEADGAPRLVGDARYVVNPDGRSCEFGIVVADDWHHSGVAQLLMEALMRAARARGLRSIEGLVLRDNEGMLDFVRELGFEVCEAAPRAPPVVRVTKRLQAAD